MNPSLRGAKRRGNPSLLAAIWIAAAAFSLLAMTPARAQEMPSLSVLADSSIALPLSRAIRAYAAHNNVAISTAFADLSDIEHQAIEGAVFDVLITASPGLLASLKQKGVVDLNSEAKVATNQLVLITSATNPFTFAVGDNFPSSAIITALDFQPGLLIGNPETLYQGTLAREALKSYGVNDDLEPYTVYEKDLDEMLENVAAQGSFAIVYATDVAFDKRFRVLGTIPETRHQLVAYSAVALAGEKMQSARSFIRYLGQSDAKQYLSR